MTLTSTDYYQAEQNGISNTLLYHRVHVSGWEKERAKTQPPRKKYNEEVHKNLKKYGISRKMLYERVNISGWTIEEASTTPPMQRRKAAARGWETRRG